MTKRRTRTADCEPHDARERLRHAKAYLEVAQLLDDQSGIDVWPVVAAGCAVLAGIAATDAICCTRINRHHRGDDHSQAARLLAEAVPGDEGRQLSNTLTRILALKDKSHYGLSGASANDARQLVRNASTLVDFASSDVTR